MLLGSVDSADASQVLYVSWNREDEKEARRCMSLGSHLCKKQKRTPALVDRKRNTVGSLARRVAAAAIGTAWGAAGGVGQRDLRRGSSGSVWRGAHERNQVWTVGSCTC